MERRKGKPGRLAPRGLLLLGLALSLSLCLAATARGAEIVDSGTCGAEGGNVQWSLDSEGTLTIWGKGAMADTEKYDDPPWISDGDTSPIHRVVIREGVTYVGEYNFKYCTELTELSLPDSLTGIGAYAFYECSSLASPIVLSNRVTGIGDWAFAYCESIREITVPVSLHLGTAFVDTGVETVRITGEGPMEDYNTRSAYQNDLCYDLTPWNSTAGDHVSVFLDDGITRIGDYAFYGCGKLTELSLPKQLEEYGAYALSGCKSIADLSEIAIPETMTRVEAGTFSNCQWLETLVIPETVTQIESSAFSGCSALREITLPAGTALAQSAFPNPAPALESVCVTGSGAMPDYSKDEVTDYNDVSAIPWRGLDHPVTVTLDDRITRIGNYAFYQANNLTVDLPKNLESIGEGAFLKSQGIESLSALKLPTGLTSIGTQAFELCTWLTSVSIPESVTSIEKRTFQYCYNIEALELPLSLRSVGTDAFYYLTKLTDVYYPGTREDWNKIENHGTLEGSKVTVHYEQPGPDSFILHLDGNGSEEVFDNLVIQTGSVYPELPAPEREDYTFAGWFTKKTGGEGISSGSQVTVTAPQTLYAHWLSEFVTIHFDGNGSEQVFPYIKTLREASIGKALPSVAEVEDRSGFLFLGWFTEPEGGDRIQAFAPPSAFIPSTENEGTLYAHWRARQAGDPSYTISFDSNGSDETFQPVSVQNEQLYGVLPCPKDHDGWLFDGWYTEKDGGEQVTEETLFTEKKDQTLYAHWDWFLRLSADTNRYANHTDEFYLPSESPHYQTRYIEKLFRMGNISKLQKEYVKTFEGSCFGISVSIAHAKKHLLPDYYGDLEYQAYDYPNLNESFRDLLNYYQLCQYLPNFHRTVSVYRDMKQTQAKKDPYATLGLTYFLVQLVDAARSITTDERLVEFHYTEEGNTGHDILICGYAYGDFDGDGTMEHQLRMYDCNDASKTFRFLYIADDFSSFDFQDSNMEDKEATDPNSKNQRLEHLWTLMSFMSGDDLYDPFWKLSSEEAPDGAALHSAQDTATLYVDAFRPCVITNREGQTLVCDGQGYDGTMELYRFSVVGTERPQAVLTVDASDSFTVTDFDGRLEMDLLQEEGFCSAAASGADRIVLSETDGVTVEGAHYSFEAWLSADLQNSDMVKFSGESGGLSRVSCGSDSVLLQSAEKLENLEVTTFRDAEISTRTLDETVQTVLVSDGTEEEAAVSALPNTGLLGAGLSWDYTPETGRLTVTGGDAGSGDHIIAAVYDGAGRMTGMQDMGPSGGSADVGRAFHHVKLLYTDSRFAPKCAAVEITAP